MSLRLEIKDLNNISYTFLVSKDIYDLAHNNASYAKKFLIMQKQKYPELFKDKPAITKTSCEQKVVELSDGSKTKKLYVPNNIYKRACVDLQYATQLFEECDEEIVKQIPHCIDTKVSAEKVEIPPSEDILLDYSNELENEENEAAALCTTGIFRHRWTTEQTKLLLSLYHEMSGSLNKGKITHKCFWDEVSTKMRKNGYAITASQCSTKLENLKKRYKKCYDHNRQSGNTPNKIEHYDTLHEIFFKSPWIQPLSIIGSSTPLGQHMDQKLLHSGRLKRAKYDKNDYMKEFLQLKKQKLENDKEYKEKKLEILRDIQNKLAISLNCDKKIKG